MKAVKWILVAAILSAGAVAAMVASCAIDDEVVYISGAECTGACSRTDPGALSCDVDLTCTPDCPSDWDCSEDAAFADCSNTDACAPPPPDGVADAGAGDAAESDDAVDDSRGDGGVGPMACTASGGGTSPEDAQEISIGDTLTELQACPINSSWFKFHVAPGTDFTVEITPYGGGLLNVRVYAGEELAVVDQAGLAGDADFSARATAGGWYFIRVRAGAAEPVAYGLALTAVGTAG